MRITRAREEIILSHLDPFLVEMLRQIPISADPSDSKAARERLFSKPSTNDAKANSDWKNYVHPDLAHIFQTANETVKADLAQLELTETVDENEEASFEANAAQLHIPAGHYESWLSSLNQARLALSARHGFTEADLNHDSPDSLETERDVSLFQIYFYGLLQECILRELS